MIAMKILDVKKFMEKLFIGPMFDDFLLVSATIKVSITWNLDGDINKDYYSTDELELLGERKYIQWSDIKLSVFNIIKGKKTPSNMKIVFLLSDEDLATFTQQFGATSTNISGLFLNIRYDNAGLTLITGTAQKSFSLDKSIEQEWDLNTKNILRQNELAFEQSC